jgi:hypothetical protein
MAKYTGMEPSLPLPPQTNAPMLGGAHRLIPTKGRMPARSWGEAIAYMGSKNERPCVTTHTAYDDSLYTTHPRATRVLRYSNGIAVRYHNTDVVTYTEAGLVLNTDTEFRSKTTKERINTALDVLPGHPRVWQDYGRWNLSGHGWYDGITMGWDGKLVGYDEAKADAEDDRLIKLREGISAYIQKVRLLITEQSDDWHDCDLCYEHGHGAYETGLLPRQHIIDHIEQMEVVDGLLVEAVCNPNSPASTAERSAMVSGWYMRYQENWMSVRIRRHIRTYLQRRVGLATN